MNKMNMTETARIIKGLRAAGWDDTKINDFMLYVEEEDETFLKKMQSGEYKR